jgi:hypothetical protein
VVRRLLIVPFALIGLVACGDDEPRQTKLVGTVSPPVTERELSNGDQIIVDLYATQGEPEGLAMCGTLIRAVGNIDTNVPSEVNEANGKIRQALEETWGPISDTEYSRALQTLSEVCT